MARPENIYDIELSQVEFAHISIDKISTDAALLKGYTAFVEAATKAGATVDPTDYRGVTFFRSPNLKEQESQLLSAQNSWDYGQKLYDTLAAVGELERSWEADTAKKWAAENDMPFPPEHEPISDFHATIAAIDEVTA